MLKVYNLKRFKKFLALPAEMITFYIQMFIVKSEISDLEFSILEVQRLLKTHHVINLKQITLRLIW